MKSKILPVFVCLFITSFSFAQTLKGKVVDGISGAAIEGVNVSFSSKNTVQSNAGGMFSIECKSQSLLTVSFVGYSIYQQKINDCNKEITVILLRKESKLDEVEITATSAQNKLLLFQPTSITKLSSVELKRGNGLFLDDAINANVPGVTMNRRSVSGGQQLNIRGYGNGSRGTRGISSNFDGQGYKVYLNGIPVTDAEGITTLDDIDFGSIGNVEVTKGPAGTLYGLAIAGAVNLKTITPEKGKTSLGQEVMLGNYGLQRYTSTLQMGLDKSAVVAGII